MSENTLPRPPHDEHGAVAALALGAVPSADQELERTTALVPVGAVAQSPAVLPLPPGELLELITQALAPGAEESTRDAAREVWARLAHALQSAPPAAPATPAPPPMPVVPPMPVAPSMPSRATAPMPLPPVTLVPPSANLPITSAVRALRQMPADQLLELLLARLRAALPAGGTVPSPKGIQFQLVPVSPPTAAR